MVRTRKRSRSNKQRGGYIEYTEEEKHPLIYDGFIEDDDITELETLNAPAKKVAEMVRDEITTSEILAYFRANPGQPNGVPVPTPTSSVMFEAPAYNTLADFEDPVPEPLELEDLDGPDSPTSITHNFSQDSDPEYVGMGGKRRKSRKSKKTRKSKKSKKTRKSKKSKKTRKHRGGNSPETAGVTILNDYEYDQEKHELNWKP